MGQIQLEYNGTTHRTTLFAPFYLVYGQAVKMSMDVLLGKRKSKKPKGITEVQKRL